MSDPNQNRRDIHGDSKIREVPKKARGGMGWLGWLLGLILLLALLFLLLRSCNRHPVAPVAAAAPPVAAASGPSTPPVGIEKVTLPGGKVVDLAPNTLNYELQRYLVSNAPAPRTFTFENLNFATDSSALPADAEATVGALADILTAYPRAMVSLQGYADASGANPHNVKLGADRALAVAKALEAKGIASDRIKTETGGASNPVDTNATAQGRAENRRTELTVTAK